MTRADLELLSRSAPGRALRLLGPPVAAFALAQLALTVAAVLGGKAPFDGATWTRYNSTSPHGSQTGVRDRRARRLGGPDELCGTAGWFPAYPGAPASTTCLGVPLGEAGLLVSLACCLAMLAVLWAWYSRRPPTPGNLLALTFAACCPAMVYTHAASYGSNSPPWRS